MTKKQQAEIHRNVRLQRYYSLGRMMSVFDLLDAEWSQAKPGPEREALSKATKALDAYDSLMRKRFENE